MAICYPNSKEDYLKIKKWIEKESKKIIKPKEVIVILDGICFQEEEIKFDWFFITKEEIEINEDTKIVSKDGYYTIAEPD